MQLPQRMHGKEVVSTVLMRRFRARVALLTSILMLTILLAGAAPAAADWKLPSKSPSVREQKIERVIRIAKRQVGDPWVWGSRGPKAFDCIGLVYYAFKQANALKLIGGSYRSIPTLVQRAHRRDRASRSNPKRGDLVVWGGTKHIGIYLGNKRAISALVSGVQVHKVTRLYDPFTTYLHLPKAF